MGKQRQRKPLARADRYVNNHAKYNVPDRATDPKGHALAVAMNARCEKKPHRIGPSSRALVPTYEPVRETPVGTMLRPGQGNAYAWPEPRADVNRIGHVPNQKAWLRAERYSLEGSSRPGKYYDARTAKRIAGNGVKVTIK